jgi:DNA-binding response OmpR family regulator
VESNRKKIVLVAEDEAPIRRLIQSGLEARGWFVLESPDGAQALDLSLSHPGPIDLLITDIRMPGLNGKDLAEQLCRTRPGLKILYISGYSEFGVKDLNRCGNREDHFLPKPFTLSTLLGKVETLLAES